MSNERIGIYEGLFLFPQSATANLQGAVDHLKGILDTAGATIKSFRKWDDRRLAYEIDGNKRGVYFLTYFNAPASSLSDIERRCNQSEEVLRMMVTKADHIPAEVIEANEGSEELATEIKLQSEKSTDAGGTATSTISKKDAKKSKAKDSSKDIEEVAKEPAEAVAEEPAEDQTEEPAEAVAEETTKQANGAETDAKEPTEEATEEIKEEPTEA